MGFVNATAPGVLAVAPLSPYRASVVFLVPLFGPYPSVRSTLLLITLSDNLSLALICQDISSLIFHSNVNVKFSSSSEFVSGPFPMLFWTPSLSTVMPVNL